MKQNKTFFFVILFLSLLLILFLVKNKMSRVTSAKITDLKKELIKTARQNKINLVDVILTEEGDIQANVDDVVIYFSTEKNLEVQVVSLQKILKSTTIKTGVREIDFRFNKIIVR